MKKRERRWGAGLALVMLVSGGSALGTDGGGIDSGGGDVIRLRRERITEWVGSARGNMSTFLVNFQPEQIADGERRQRFESLLDLGLAADVAASNYTLEEQCVDEQGRSHDAVAGHGDRGGEICFSLDPLSRGNADERTLFELLIHEHAHHLDVREEGVADSYAIAVGRYVAAWIADRSTPGRDVVVPGSSGRCFSFRDYIARRVVQNPSAPAWGLVTTGASAAVESPQWYEALVEDREVTEMRVDQLLPTHSYYQIGCEKVLFKSPSQEGHWLEVPIVRYSSNFVEIRFGTDLPLTPERVEVVALDGPMGSRLEIRSFGIELTGRKTCSDGSSVDHRGLMDSRFRVTIDSRLPAEVSFPVESLRRLQAAHSTLLELARQGCSVDMIFD